MTENTVAAVRQALKKNSFLLAITEEHMTKAQIVDALEEFDFLSSWLDYLIEHFVEQGKLIVGVKDGVDGAESEVTWARKGKKGSAGPRKVYLVEFDEDAGDENTDGAYIMTDRILDKGEVINKNSGEATTANRAIKNATSAVFAQYKADTAAIKTLLETPEADPKSDPAEPDQEANQDVEPATESGDY